MEELSRTTYAIHPEDRSKQTIWFFERVSGQYKEALNKENTKSKQDSFKLKYPKDQLLIKSDVAKVMNIWKLQPYHVSKGSQKNYVSFLKEIDKEPKSKKINRVYWEDIVANAILFRETDKLFGRKNVNAIGDTNIKSHTIGYALAYFHCITDNKLNLAKIWSTQHIEDELLQELRKLVVFTYNFFTNLDVALISEAAKSEKTWLKLKEMTNNPMNMAVVSKHLISDKEFKARYESELGDIKEVEKYDSLQRISSLGLKFWDGLCVFMLKKDCLSVYQQNFVSTIRKKLKLNTELTDVEIEKGAKIIDALEDQGFDLLEIKSLSKLTEDKVSDAGTIFHRISAIDNDTWKKVTAIGEQTGKLNENEISAVKAVIQKLKTKSNIDIHRLNIVNEALDKIKKYGLKV